MSVSLAILVLAATASVAAASEDPARQAPFGGEQPPALIEAESSPGARPKGFGLTAVQAINVAEATDVVRDELAESPDAKPTAYVRGERWQVSYFDGDAEVARVILDAHSGEVDEALRDFQVETPLARGYEGAVAQNVNSPWVWIALCLLFVAPFFDPRRPFRLLHVDLLVLLGLGISLAFFNQAEITASVALTYPVLGYFLVRMLVAGMRPRTRSGPLVPFAPVKWLVIGVAVLLCARIMLNVVDSRVIDIGLAGVVGADRIGEGLALYEGGFSTGIDLKGDVYGPANYLAYVPFEQAFAWDGTWGELPSAHAASIAFDLLCVGGLVLLGRGLREGADGRTLGWALAFAWAACPWTLYAMNAGANDALVAALSIGSMLALASPAGRGVFVGLSAAAKFGSAALGPLFATASGERRWRSAAIFAVAFAVVAAAVTLPFVPDGGLSELYDRSFGYQASRGSPFSIWGQAPSLDDLQPLARAGAVALAIAVAFYPRTKSPFQIAALAAAVTVAIQLTANHWFYFYVVWFLPFALVASFGEAFEDNENGPPQGPGSRQLGSS